MMMIEISDSKLDKMSEYMGKVLKYGSKVMECLDEAANGGYGERNMGYRDEMGQRGSSGYRDDDEEMERRMGMRKYGRRMGFRDPQIYY